MSPYAPFYRHLTDQMIVLSLVVAWIVFGAFLFHRRFQSANRAEVYLLAALRAFLILSFCILGVFVFGVGFLLWPSVLGIFGYVWELFYIVSVICVFWTLPLFSVLFLGWALVGRWRADYGQRTLWWSLGCVLSLIASGLLYYAIEFISAYQCSAANAG